MLRGVSSGPTQACQKTKINMTLEQSSIYINVLKLRKKLYEAQFLMDKANRIIYGTPLLASCHDVLKNFILAFTVQGKRESYLEESLGNFAVLRVDLDFCIKKNIIHYNDKQRLEIIELVAQIDEDICKWEKSIARKK